MSKAEAVGWRHDAVVAVRQGRLRPSSPKTVEDAGRALTLAMRSGAILDRSGTPYKPKTIRTYEHALETCVYPLLGHRKVSSLQRAYVQGFVEEMRSRYGKVVAEDLSEAADRLDAYFERHRASIALGPRVGPCCTVSAT